VKMGAMDDNLTPPRGRKGLTSTLSTTTAVDPLAENDRHLLVSPSPSYTEENIDDEYSDNNSLNEVDAALALSAISTGNLMIQSKR
jgi:hypothetical protein